MKVCRRIAPLIGVAVLLTSCGSSPDSAAPSPALIAGPFASLLDSSQDLGISGADGAAVTVGLRDAGRPAALIEWAGTRGLSVRWRPGEDWAIVEGGAGDIARAFDVSVHDYRGRKGQVFYASRQQPEVPRPLSGTITDVGRILGYTPHHMARPDFFPLDVPVNGLGRNELLTAYNANPLVEQGYTGKGSTVVFFAFDGYEQSDLDTFADSSNLPRFTPILVGGNPGPPHGETVMDLEVVHAIAPDARLVVVNARPTVEGGGAYEKIGEMFRAADRDYPGAVWSLSIGWACDAFPTQTDLAPVRSALVEAQKRGTTAFDASGDNGGLECKGGDDWSSPPGPSDIGLDAVSSIPEMTSVGGTTLSTDAAGNWLSEQAWGDGPLSQGSSGGVSKLYDRPDYQRRVSSGRDGTRRLAPDVSAVADPFTGVRIVFGGKPLIGAGTSQAAPIWAGLTVLMNQYLEANGGKRLGELNPSLYQVAAGADLPGFRDVSLGGNAVDQSTPGYDLVTGLGSPNVDNLVRNLLDVQHKANHR
ncbi:MAG TPA: S53 family peptidase [Mycobacterium sp.]|nr:S53 family peptidase [Mycobacterium sp.]